MGVTDRVGGLCAPLCERVGVELLDVEYNGGVLRVTIDHPDGVGMDAIAVLTREVSRALDHEDPLPGRYTLEVSSPGLERPLRRPEHFARVVGASITVKTTPDVEGERRLVGTLEQADSDGITVRTPVGDVRALRYDEIQKARTVFEWDSGAARKSSNRGQVPQPATDESEVGR